MRGPWDDKTWVRVARWVDLFILVMQIILMVLGAGALLCFMILTTAVLDGDGDKTVVEVFSW